MILTSRLKNITLIKLVGVASESVRERTYLVGGTVRDAIIGKENKDLDFVSSNSERVSLALAKKIDKLYGEKPKISVFKKFGTVRMNIMENEVEFVDPRKETYAYSSIKPEVKSSKYFIDDVLRRDFTLNALYLGIQSDDWMKIIDLSKKGLKDLQMGVLRTPVNPNKTFKDDPSRLLRLIRFSSCKGFKIDPTTEKSAYKNRKEILRVPIEMVKQEIDKGILCNNYFNIMDRIGILDIIFPEISKLKGLKQPSNYHAYDVFVHTLRVVNFLPKDRILRWCGLFHDIGKYKMFSEKGDFHKHEDYSKIIAIEIMKRTKFSNSEMRDISFIVKNHMYAINLMFMDYSDKAVRRYISESGIYLNYLLAFAEADLKGSGRNVRINIEKLNKLKNEISKQQNKLVNKEQKFALAINGNDVMKVLDIEPSQKVGKILDKLKQKVIDGELENSKESLIKYIEKM